MSPGINLLLVGAMDKYSSILRQVKRSWPKEINFHRFFLLQVLSNKKLLVNRKLPKTYFSINGFYLVVRNNFSVYIYSFL